MAIRAVPKETMEPREGGVGESRGVRGRGNQGLLSLTGLQLDGRGAALFVT